MKKFLAYYRLSTSQLNSLLSDPAAPDDETPPKPSLRVLAEKMNIDVDFMNNDEWRAFKTKLISSMRHTLGNLITEKILVKRFDEDTRREVLHWSDKVRGAFISDEWWGDVDACLETVATEDGPHSRGDSNIGEDRGRGGEDGAGGEDGGRGGGGGDAPNTPPATPRQDRHQRPSRDHCGYQGAENNATLAWLVAQANLPPTAPSTPQTPRNVAVNSVPRQPDSFRSGRRSPGSDGSSRRLDARLKRALQALFDAERSLEHRRIRHINAYFEAIEGLWMEAGGQSRYRMLSSLVLSTVQPLLRPTEYTLVGVTALDRAHVAHYNARNERDAASDMLRDIISGRGFRGVWPVEA